jgi:hypothetical protein
MLALTCTTLSSRYIFSFKYTRVWIEVELDSPPVPVGLGYDGRRKYTTDQRDETKETLRTLLLGIDLLIIYRTPFVQVIWIGGSNIFFENMIICIYMTKISWKNTCSIISRDIPIILVPNFPFEYFHLPKGQIE